tara:strand:+ start:5637 stop:6221 length:585 start_codon:yes stop_codon:yes gene_type:complete
VQNQSNKKVAVRWIITLGLLISSMIVSSASLKKSSIEYKDKKFLYSFEAQINARHDRVLDKLHNFEQWDRLNDNISKSKVLETLPRNKIKRLLTLTQCIFTFCFNLKFVEIVTLSKDRLEMNIVAGEGNFSAGRAIWETVSEGTYKTLIRVNATLSPDFWIPPVVGPLVLEKVFLKQIKKTIETIETLAKSRKD